MAIQDNFIKNGLTYKIVNIIDLEGETLNIPYDSTLIFEGGKIKNGTLNINNVKIIPNGCVITDYITATIEGTYKKGQCLFDGELNKPKWWTGSKWVDAIGADV